MKKFFEKKFDTLDEALKKMTEVKRFLISLGFRNHFILKEVYDGVILEMWFMSEEN